MCKGLRQGDLMSPFLFILAIEALHEVLRKAINIRLFRGVEIGANSFSLSHLMYADDVIFEGEWSLGNANNVIGLLR